MLYISAEQYLLFLQWWFICARIETTSYKEKINERREDEIRTTQ